MPVRRTARTVTKKALSEGEDQRISEGENHRVSEGEQGRHKTRRLNIWKGTGSEQKEHLRMHGGYRQHPAGY